MKCVLVSQRGVVAVWVLPFFLRWLKGKFFGISTAVVLMSYVNIVFLSCLLGAKLLVKVAEVIEATIENYLLALHTYF